MDENAERISLELIAGDRVQTILPGIVRLRLPICNSTRIGGDRTRRDDVAVGKPKIPSSGHVPEITPLHHCPQ